jgi:hypothetical protein
MIKRLHPDLPWEQSDAIYHEIGIFIVKFSEIVSMLRTGIVVCLGSDPFSVEFAEINAVFDKMTADPIRTAFFTLCGESASLDDEDCKIRDVMNMTIQRLAERRNEIAHADWSIGWVENETNKVVPPVAHKIHASVKKGLSNRQVFDPKRLHNLVWEALTAYEAIKHFVWICRDRVTGEGDARLRDKLEIDSRDWLGKFVKVKSKESDK